jgi:D-3-phosphoglycerate dehydrogenase / 2-oxoglutarate reductase
MKVLLTSTSFQDNRGAHQDLYNKQAFNTDFLRGPLSEDSLLEIINQYDALLCGDDEITQKVLEKGKSGKLKYISKYGVGLDKIDMKAADELGIPVKNCPGVNQISVAEHVFALLLTFFRNVHLEYNHTRNGNWIRLTGSELHGKTIGIIGLGAIGKEVAKRAKCFGMNVLVQDKKPDLGFISKHTLINSPDVNILYSQADIISLHIPLLPDTENMINKNIISTNLKRGVVIVNTARGKLVNLDDLKDGLSKGIIKGYLADVLDNEPMPENYSLKDFNGVIITPHIGSRTQESVEKQGLLAVQNLINLIGTVK